MIKIAGVRFKENWKVYDFDATGVDVSVGDNVIVDSDRGPGFARVVRLKQVNGQTANAAEPPSEKSAEEQEIPKDTDSTPPDSGKPETAKVLRRIVRKATPDDIQKEEKNRAREAEAFAACQELIAERELLMKLIRVEYSFDAARAIFFFFSESRVDFRELVKDLAYKFKIRIEMRQIGVRDVARLVGGYGPCGRDLCCASFLRNFEPVSIRMAKKQEMVLNPAKISGVCGRLLCCLSYEYEFYDEIKKDVASLRDREKKEEDERRTTEDRNQAEVRRIAEEKRKEEERKQNQERRERQKEGGAKGGAKTDKKKEPPQAKKPGSTGPQPGGKQQRGKPEQQPQPPQQKPAQKQQEEKGGQPKGRRRFWRRRRKKPGNTST